MLLSYSMKSSLQREPGKQPIYKLRKKKEMYKRQRGLDRNIGTHFNTCK